MAGDNKAKILRDAEKFVLQGKIPQAINEYLKIVKTDPNDILTLNTIGDLYLRQGKMSEANKYFTQVAESYTRNNFLLKAIAVYKKILVNDAENLDINLTLASLYAKQGLQLNARTQYELVADICAKQGKKKESREAFERVVELDPVNAPVQLKLAEIYLAEKMPDRAHSSFVGAARAQARANDFRAAVASYRRAMQINPIHTDAMRGFLDAALELGDVTPALEQLKESTSQVPDDLDFREMLGRAYIAAGEFESALEALQIVAARDESRYEIFFELAKNMISAGQHDGAALSLDTVRGAIIDQRDTDRAEEIYRLILQAAPDNLLAIKNLAEIYSITNQQSEYLQTLDKLADVYYHKNQFREALEPLERILEVTPESEKHVNLHREAFFKAFPDAHYQAPVAPPPAGKPAAGELAELKAELGLGPAPKAGAEEGAGSLVEVDLMINYGMREKALGLLLAMCNADPNDKEVRSRLINLFRDSGQNSKAGEECLALSALYRKENNLDAAQRYLEEARRLAPELASETAQAAMGQGAGFALTQASKTPTPEEIELDLSGELSEIFFKEPEPGTIEEVAPASEVESVNVESLKVSAPKKLTSENVHAELQEVDFYIQLGFLEEARNKLDEISAVFPEHPEVTERMRQLEEARAQQSPGAEVAIPLGGGTESAPETAKVKEDDVLGSVKFDLELENVEKAYASESQSPEPIALGGAESYVPDQLSEVLGPPAEEPSVPGKRAGPVTSPTAARLPKLLDDVAALSEEVLAKEDFETHFNTGIAYREMALLDDAIREFQIAIRKTHPSSGVREAIRCCGMLSTCYLEKGMPQSTIEWCETGLNFEDIQPHEAMALRYDLGIAYSQNGELKKAMECFNFIAEIDPRYRDVPQRVEKLRGLS